MKKQLIYTGMLLMAAGFSACNEDYKDWADPQSNPQLDPSTQVSAVFAAGKDANIVVDDHDIIADSVEVAKFVSMTAAEGSTVKFNSLILNDTYAIPFAVKENVLKVALTQLDSLAQLVYKSRAGVERELKLNVKASAVTSDGEGLLLAGNDVTVKLKPGATPALDPEGYSVVGDFQGWTIAGAIAFKQDAANESLYILETEAPKDRTNFKIFPASALKGADIDWSKTLGNRVDQSTSDEDFIVWADAQIKEAGAIQIAKAGKVKITIDMTNFRYTVKDNSAPTELFMTGSAYNWGGEAGNPAMWKQLTPVNGTKGAFWGIFHFAVDEQVKFAPQAAWTGGDFGFTGTTISQTSIDRASLSESGGNIMVGKAGWYLVYVSVVGNDRMVEFEEAAVYLTGDCAVGGWGTQFGEGTKFDAPADATGDFASPAFVKDGDIRMCVRPANISAGDWWKTEFAVIGGKIVFRGNEGNQPAVAGKLNQKVYLNFSTGTGKVQ